MSAPARDRAPVEHFERLAREAEDPWDYASSDYEQAKYRRTLEALPPRCGDALELGCSVGVFTAMLAPRCESLLAVDFSPTALQRARQRVEGCGHVAVERRRLPEETPEGPFETILCCELLYYWSEPLVLDQLRRLEAALAPGGTLLAVHWRGADRRRELTGDDVHRILLEQARLRHEGGDSTPNYLLDRWSKP